MNFSKDFYKYLIYLVNEGYKAVKINHLMNNSNILLFSTGDITISTNFILKMLKYRKKHVTLTIISQPLRIGFMKEKIHNDNVVFVEWKGKYTESVLSVLDNKYNKGFDSMLFFGSTPVAASNSNLLDIADDVIESPRGRGCFVYSYVDSTLYEYDNIHSFYSAIQIYEHINKLLDYEYSK